MRPIRQSAAGFPMAPTQVEWDALPLTEREAVGAALPGEVTDAEMSPPEGDLHFQAKARALDALGRFYRSTKRRAYVSAELPVYYPNAPRFAPDLLVVMDADDHERTKWMVSAEEKGLDWVLEVHVGGERKKDAERNVSRYAQLGIREYFIYDRARSALLAYRLTDAKAHTYVLILPQRGLYFSQALGLQIEVQRDGLRFRQGTALLLETEELIVQLESRLELAQGWLAEEVRLCLEDRQAENARLRAELEALKNR